MLGHLWILVLVFCCSIGRTTLSLYVSFSSLAFSKKINGTAGLIMQNRMNRNGKMELKRPPRLFLLGDPPFGVGLGRCRRIVRFEEGGC
jgi:hypothetical protein